MMKIVISILLLVGVALCEVPPPYSSRGFRPSPPFNLPVRQPQTTYGVPNAAPSKFSQFSPQTESRVPNQQGVRPVPSVTINFSSKQQIPSTSYGVPETTNPYKSIISEPQVTYGVPKQQGVRPTSNLTPNFNSKHTIPSTSYAISATSEPYRTISSEPQISYGVPNQQDARPISNSIPNFNSKQTIPSTSYGVPVTSSPYRTIISESQIANGQIKPSNQYGLPGTDTKNVETLEQIRQLNLLLQLSQSSKSNQQNQIGINLSQSQSSNQNVRIPSQQYLPTREASNFRGDLQSSSSQGYTGQPTQQYLPIKEPTNFRNGFALPQFNDQESFDVKISNTNLQQPSQQYLPGQPSNGFPQPAMPQGKGINILNNSLRGNSNNYQQPYEQMSNADANFQNRAINLNQLPLTNRNTNIASTSQNPNPNSNNYQTSRPNIEVEQLNVRQLPNSNKNSQSQTPTRQNKIQPTLSPVLQNRQYGVSRIRGANREQIDEKYLPSTTSRPTSLPRDNSAEDEQPTQSEEEAGGPNIAVATAVSGTPPGQSFYLLQPDGRLQRVIYQKTRAEGDLENEYTANYLFQNIQADSGLVYNPLITIGKR